MPIHHTTRTGKTYYLHVGQGKSGKPNYFFSTERQGPLVDSVPEGFEIYETVRGQVFLRRKQSKQITDEELAMVKEALKRHAEEWRYRVEVKKTAVIIHEAPDNAAGLESIALPWISKATIKQAAIQSAAGELHADGDPGVRTALVAEIREGELYVRLSSLTINQTSKPDVRR